MASLVGSSPMGASRSVAFCRLTAFLRMGAAHQLPGAPTRTARCCRRSWSPGWSVSVRMASLRPGHPGPSRARHGWTHLMVDVWDSSCAGWGGLGGPCGGPCSRARRQALAEQQACVPAQALSRLPASAVGWHGLAAAQRAPASPRPCGRSLGWGGPHRVGIHAGGVSRPPVAIVLPIVQVGARRVGLRTARVGTSQRVAGGPAAGLHRGT